MLKIDQNFIKDKLSGVSFNFLTDQEIERLSVVEVCNPQTFDHLDNPNPEGLHDKRMGVSPFDRNGICPTCGLTSNFCTGHHGHIQLVAPIYNPFMIKEMYRIMKSKCFYCNRLRINDSKIGIFTSALKLIKAGEIVGSQRLKQHFFSLSKDLAGQISASGYKEKDIDQKQITKVKNVLNLIFQKHSNEAEHFSDQDIQQQFKQYVQRFNIEREKFENEIINILQDVEENDNPEATNKIQSSGFTSIIQKFQIDMIREIWSNVITTKCPHCKKNSPAFRKDGYTKMFVKPLAGRIKQAADQRKRIADGGSETQTIASTNLDKSRKTSAVNDDCNNTDEEDKQSSDQDDNEEEHFDVDDGIDEEFKEGSAQKFISPQEVKDHIEKTWKKDGEILSLIYGKYEPLEINTPFQTQTLGPQMFFLNKIVVPPNRFRPEREGALAGGSSGSGKAYLHAHSAMLLKIMNANMIMKDALLDQNKATDVNLLDTQIVQKQGKLGITTQRWIQLQEVVNCFMDSSMASKNADKENGGIRQLLEKKEGMFRMKMMGKRVNYGGRSVISPDPYITTDQIGIPVFMARKLTFPESVSSFNAERLRQAVINGPKQHPGANIIENEETGEQIHLDNLKLDQREGIARLLTVGQKIVYRHLRNGDPLLVNRQPTLHKPSIMAHRCRVLPKEQTIRMHYANCNTYNADFDGDEMNIHLPQNFQSISEAYNLMATHKQYCVPTSGKPLRGLIQDSVVSGVFLSSKDTFLQKDQYNQLVYIGLRELIEMDQIGKIETMLPAILKPKALWTGKQVITTLLKNIVNREQEYKASKLTGLNVSFKSKLSAKEWGSIGKEEGEVVFRDNEHLKGTLDKNAFGASEYGLVHAFYEVYGSEKAGELLTSLARVFTVFLQTYGFTCGLDDLIINRKHDKLRREAIEEGHKQGIKAAAKFCQIHNYEPEQMNFSNRVIYQSKTKFDKDFDQLTQMSLPKNPLKDKNCIQLDNAVRKALELKMQSAGPDLELLDAELDNLMQGKMNDATSNILKQIIPDGLIKKFPHNNLSAMVMTGAKGGIVNQTQISALLGQQSLEGRRVPKMQNGKTLPCFLPFDPNPRSSGYISDRFITGLRPQDFYFHCMAGREGLIDTAVKTSRSGYLQRCLIKQLESLIVNYDMTVRDNDGSVVQFMYGDDGIDVINTKYLDKFDFLESNFNSLISSGQDILRKVDSEKVQDYKKSAKRAARQLKKVLPSISSKEAFLRSSDPLLSIFHPQKYFGSISDQMSMKIDKYTKEDCQYMRYERNREFVVSRKYNPIEPETFRKMYYMKYMKSLVHPGENVGTIAAQSVGEPSTQMTLNTFHLAGHGAGNMTLGIPRLKEILMTTPYNIKTPIMKIFFNKQQNQISKEQMQKFANKFQKIKLVEIVKLVNVFQNISRDPTGFCRIYKIELTFDDIKALKSNLSIDQSRLSQLFNENFIPSLMIEIFKQFKKADDASTLVMRTSTKELEKNEDQLIDDFDTQELEGNKNLKRGSSAVTTQINDIDDDDMLSDNEKEIMDEVNTEMDGNIKIYKNLRGYDDMEQDELESINQDNLNHENKSSDDQQPQNKKAIKKIQKNLDTSLKPKETNQRYQQFLRGIDFDKDKNMATVKIAFPLEFKKVLMLTIVEQTLKKILVRSVQNIEKCTLIYPKKETDEPYLIVQGINFDAFYPYQDIIDLQRVETNHSYALKNKYGVEAMRANIMKEVQMVFGVYGISVDVRHLSLISDFMTFNGDYRAFNRIGMEESSSPFLKMSYETTMKYLVSASQANETDDMSSPSSAIVLGQIPRVGTGMFDLIQRNFQ